MSTKYLVREAIIWRLSHFLRFSTKGILTPTSPLNFSFWVKCEIRHFSAAKAALGVQMYVFLSVCQKITFRGQKSKLLRNCHRFDSWGQICFPLQSRKWETIYDTGYNITITSSSSRHRVLKKLWDFTILTSSFKKDFLQYFELMTSF